MKKNKWFALMLFLCWTSQVFAAACGDVNSDNKIDILDALMIAQYTVGMNPQPFDQTAAEVSLDGYITIVDALIIAQYSVGIRDYVYRNMDSPDYPCGYIYCAEEGDTVRFDYFVDLAYGADGVYNYIYSIMGSITFDQDTFGFASLSYINKGYYRPVPPTPTPW